MKVAKRVTCISKAAQARRVSKQCYRLLNKLGILLQSNKFHVY